VDGRAVAVLGALNQKHHKERHDRRSGVDDELPGILIAEHRARGGPYNDERTSPANPRRARRRW
jgi:hypothetical protein